MLFTISVSPFYIDFCCFISFLKEQDDVLLIQDGVLIGQNIFLEKKENCFLKKLINKKVNIFALKEDVEIRGLDVNFSSFVSCVSYRGFVRLTVKNKNCFFW